MKPNFWGAVGATCLLIGIAQADLKWTETIKMGGVGGSPAGMSFSIQTTRYMNAEASRTDTTSKMGPMTMVSREIDSCPTKKTLTFYDAGKLYSEGDLKPASLIPGMSGIMGGMAGETPGDIPGGMGGMPGGGNTNKPKKTGTQTVSFNLRDLGTEKILDIDTHHYALDTTLVSTGCAGNGTQKTSMEVWKANIPMPAPCLATTLEGTVKSTVRIASDCDVKTTIEGNTTDTSAVFDGFIMRMKLGMGQGSFTREVTMLSRAPVEAEVFEVPTDYRKVTRSELEKARQTAMMKAMMGGMMGGGDDGEDDDNGDAPDTGDTE